MGIPNKISPIYLISSLLTVRPNSSFNSLSIVVLESSLLPTCPPVEL